MNENKNQSEKGKQWIHSTLKITKDQCEIFIGEKDSEDECEVSVNNETYWVDLSDAKLIIEHLKNQFKL